MRLECEEINSCFLMQHIDSSLYCRQKLWSALTDYDELSVVASFTFGLESRLIACLDLVA